MKRSSRRSSGFTIFVTGGRLKRAQGKPFGYYIMIFRFYCRQRAHISLHVGDCHSAFHTPLLLCLSAIDLHRTRLAELRCYQTRLYHVALPLPCWTRWLADTSICKCFFNPRLRFAPVTSTTWALAVAHALSPAQESGLRVRATARPSTARGRSSPQGGTFAAGVTGENRQSTAPMPGASLRIVPASAQSAVIAFLVRLDYAFERRIRHIGIAAAQQQQGGQHPRQAAIAISNT